MAPVGALHERPPLAPVAQVRHVLLRREHQRAGVEHVRQRARIILRVRRDLGRRDVARCPDKRLELAVRHRRAVEPEGVDRHTMDRRFFRVVIVGTHAEGAAGNRDHVAGSAILRWRVVLPGGGPQQRHGANSRRARLRTDVPEALRLARIGAVPAVTGGRRRASRSHHRGGDQSDYGARGDRAARAHTFESLRCAANLTNMRRHCRMHFQALSCLPATSLMCAARISVSTPSLS